MHKDLISSFILPAIAAAYYVASTSIPVSSLEDEIGPRGLPAVLAVLLLLLAIAIGARAFVAAAAAARPAETASAQSGAESEAPWPRALGLLAIGAMYVPVVEVLGYFVTLFLLLAGIALYEGMKPSWRLFAIALGGSAFFWILFTYVLSVRQPAGFLF